VRREDRETERQRERLHSPIEIEGVAKGFLELDFTAEEPF
jgi:hypothetical protein